MYHLLLSLSPWLSPPSSSSSCGMCWLPVVIESIFDRKYKISWRWFLNTLHHLATVAVYLYRIRRRSRGIFFHPRPSTDTRKLSGQKHHQRHVTERVTSRESRETFNQFSGNSTSGRHSFIASWRVVWDSWIRWRMTDGKVGEWLTGEGTVKFGRLCQTGAFNK